jgi:UDP-N-acetylglucosamine acyltransferase
MASVFRKKRRKNRKNMSVSIPMSSVPQKLDSRAVHSTDIDSKAHVSKTAEIGAGCIIGPFAVIGDKVRLGNNCTIHAHAVIDGPTEMGPFNEVCSFACIGGNPQDLRHRGEPTTLAVGEGNIFREHVTVNRGTVHGGGRTIIGDFNLFMAYSHVAHDCMVGNRAVLANHVTLAGHVVVGDYAVFGGMAAVGTFLRIGESSMTAASAMVERDVPPFCIVAGDRAELRAVNRVGLLRREFSDVAKRQIKTVFRALKDPSVHLKDIPGLFRSGRLKSTPGAGDKGMEDLSSPEIERLLVFLETATRGVAR